MSGRLCARIVGGLSVMILYFGGMAYAGIYFARRNKSTEEYFLGNRAFPGWAIGISLVGTSISSNSFLGIPADTFKTSWLRYTFSLGFPLAILAGAYVFLPFYRRGRVTSAFEYLEARFGPSTRLYGAVAFLVSQVVRLAMVLYLLSLMFATVTGINPTVCIILCGFFVAFYTVAGGIEAVVWTDVVQTIVLGVGAALCLVEVVLALPGGLGEIVSVGLADNKLALAELMTDGTLRSASWSFSLGEKTALMLFFVGLTHFMAEYACNQNVVQRYCASASAREARKAMLICCVASLGLWTFFYFLGTGFYAYYHAFPDPAAAEMASGVRKAEEILPYFVVHQLPVGMTGLVLAAIFAAAMSSLDSSINAIATVSVVDIYRRHLVKDQSDRHYLKVARWIAISASAMMIGGAWVFLVSKNKTIADTSVIISAVVAGGLLGLYLLGFLTRIGEARAVGIAIICTVFWSAYMTLIEYDSVLPHWLQIPEGVRLTVDTYYTGIIGHLVMFTAGYAMGVILPRRPRDLTNLTVWTQDRSPLT